MSGTSYFTPLGKNGQPLDEKDETYSILQEENSPGYITVHVGAELDLSAEVSKTVAEDTILAENENICQSNATATSDGCCNTGRHEEQEYKQAGANRDHSNHVRDQDHHGRGRGHPARGQGYHARAVGHDRGQGYHATGQNYHPRGQNNHDRYYYPRRGQYSDNRVHEHSDRGHHAQALDRSSRWQSYSASEQSYHGRRPYRGRGRGHRDSWGGVRSQFKGDTSHDLFKDVDISQRANSIIKSWRNKDSIQPVQLVADKTEFKVVGSFNYIEDDSKKGTGISPGVAPMYVALNLEGQELSSIREDYRETTGSMAMQLFLRTMLYKFTDKIGKPPFSNYDVVITERALCRLFRFCTGFVSKTRPAYRIDIERIGNQLIIDRSSHEPDVYLNKRVFDYVKRTSKQFAKDLGQYIEAHSYKLGAIRLLVRSWVPCVDYDGAPDEAFLSQQMVELEIGESSSGMLSKHQVQVGPEHKWYSGLTAQRRYKRVDLTTHSVTYESDSAGGKWPDLFFTDSPKLIQCMHEKGWVKGFKQFTIEEVEQNFNEVYGEKPSYFLSKMAKLLEEIMGSINQQPQEKELFALICEFDSLRDESNLLQKLPSALLLLERIENDNTERFLPLPSKQGHSTSN